MAEPGRQDVTLNTLHEDLTAGFREMRAGVVDLKATLTEGFQEMRAGFADLKTTLVAGFRGLPSRESSEEMVRLLREGNRLQEARFAQLDVRIREQHLETQQILHALAEGQRALVEILHAVAEGQRALVSEVRSLSADIKALIARLDAMIKGRGDGSPPA
ncbi:MAG: hypothetical protein HY727_01430 [Candidatus Rokubacteria bacterium]|nr:hypothetical protein [Candidatus Rokubacteria bacterium]